ncbi:hypothetical protein CIL05_11075 [Virgibacillus profundi]|uniref:Dynamin N-terminal domain-containing protein n=1 Tax=Virgibacillus profundi TaxID=2024555 RepID=A0A2A2ICU3_9BACI|nr:dynamin family protein [Virgibacillus profundi]PAV29402.1 hypothetical protein CIL05_11075 [Virgibacillus profundi]PXY53572.1 hypothetical protein CIT14_11185 [Virgibacillus profundi]
MIELETNQTKTSLTHLAAYHKLMLANDDEQSANKIRELYVKLDKNELMISFAGHFSAGKSSMINALLSKDILPKSPIPTSANIVKINSGDGVARVFFHHDHPVEYKEPYDLDMIKDYSKDKDSIKKIEISTAEQIVPVGCSLVDTPGIDAADDADRVMTEASLHLVDVLFYVMDYNHVQSEVNLQFLKALQEKSIPFYVIINQIDKHDEEELAFSKFSHSIKQTFDQWQIFPECVFYSSLLDPDAKHNQFIEIKEKLFSIMEKEKDLFFNLDQSVIQVIKEHKRYLQQKYEENLSQYVSDESELENNFARIDELEENRFILQSEPDEIEKLFQNELNNTLKNAYLMPADLRDKATAFLKSQQSDFKVGLFSSKRKTAEEREGRLAAFVGPLQENMETALQWKLRDKFTNLVKDYKLSDPEVQKQIHNLSVVYTGDKLVELIKPGAKVTGDSVLNYTNDVSADIKQQFKYKARTLLTDVQRVIQSTNKDKLTKIEKELQDLYQKKSLRVKQDAIKTELAEKFEEIDMVPDASNPDEEAWNLLQRYLEADHTQIMPADLPIKLEKFKENNIQLNEIEEKINEPTQSVNHVLESINKTIQTIEGLPGFQAIINDLEGKHDRLNNRTYTIALFGAFSAGKSSFANALLGERVLPVSPNPTTATVNRITPVTNNFGHGTVAVTLKNEDMLIKDIELITKQFSPPATNLEGLLNWIQDNQIQQNSKLNNMYQAYLQAMLTGYHLNKEFIGKTRTITLDEFAAFVTDETKACYTESIDLYYDCSITRQGITLVDTPGADSVNARHTNVAFEYIKHADAILYVTYYNHALSHADKNFLMQLGRVKEAFELDKMFFIVNAADLAKDEEELQLVTNYVQEQLIKLGIRFPKLYPVSSRQSLENKLDNHTLNNEMQLFEDEFYHFIHNDLAAITVQSALWDINRTSQSMQEYMRSVNLDEKEKETYRKDLLAEKTVLVDHIEKFETGVYKEQITQKVEKQLYYVMERLGIRFHDLFKESFNPTTITETGKSANHQLRTSLDNLLGYTSFELRQELQAVSLRMESFVKTLLVEVHNGMKSKSSETGGTLFYPDLSPQELETPDYKEAFESIDMKRFDKALAGFKGTKSFFAKNEKEVMKENIYQELEPIAEEYIYENKLIMDDAYINQWSHLIDEMKEAAKHHLDNQMNNKLEVLTSAVDMKVLTEKNKSLLEILKSYR